MEKDKYYQAAQLIHETLRIKSNCFSNNKIIPAKYLIAIDDDVTSAIWAVKLYNEIFKVHGYKPKIICVGGKGLMSKHTHKMSEAELLAYVCQRLGVPDSDLIILGEGRNSGDNVLAVAKTVPAEIPVIWCVTQRLSLRLERTQAQQAPQIQSSYFVIEESIDKVMKLYNGKGLCHGQMLYHELASILNRCEAYSGTFQKPLEFEISPQVREAAKILEKNFRLKLPGKTFRSYLQFIQLFFAIKANRKKMQKDLEDTLKSESKNL